MIKFPNFLSNPLSFGAKLSLWYASLLILSVCLIFTLCYYAVSSALFARELNTQELFIQDIQLWHAQGGVSAVQLRLQNDPRNNQGSYFVRINDGARQSLFNISSEENPTLKLSTIEKIPFVLGTQHLKFQDQNRSHQWIILTAMNPAGCTFQIGHYPLLTHDVLDQFRYSFLILLLPVILIASMAGALLTFRTLRPLRQLSTTIDHLVDHGNLASRIPQNQRHGELNQLISQFNRILETNDQSIHTMHDALDNVAHDLRTPITRLRSSAESALNENGDPLVSRDALADCLEEAEKIQLILNSLMDVAEARTGVMQLQREPLVLLDLVQDVVELYSFVAEEEQMTFKLDIDKNLIITGDRSRLRQALANLVDNAIKYGAKGQTIELIGRQELNCIYLEIRDRGLGISPLDLPRIWERLYRGDKSRHKRGLGLGLSLVQAIVHAHEGTLSVKSELGTGSTFTLTLPASTAPAT